MQQLMKQAQKMQADMLAAQAELAEAEALALLEQTLGARKIREL